MRFYFSENMYGTYREIGGQGRTGRFDFSCRVEANGIVRFLTDRLTRLFGQVNIEGIGDGLPIEGVLRIDPIFGRELVYDFYFRAQDARYRFIGRKDVQFLRPVWSMTHMKGRLEKDGVAFADVESYFNLKELPKFLSSFRAGL